MPHPRYFGYQRRHDDVLITHGCRVVGRVQGDDRVHALLAELQQDDPQQVLTRWIAVVGRSAPATEGCAP
ncbi:hypothetical protein GXW83_16405 [Streptacidiphilus sp. PB12-B1b]|uniref:hypothetical protein n=1 Tax=Streptacidiphilus sp. PB12-B1b TaxID=2705012 RepID=UPI0015F8EE03|nr:hypothetical protein [Streptacidiphilus sp. PB12-B1b]QMU77051.1 hypothetical protein GXW83_16405 [Streptacidiphilus sp. PB12-B1b]